MYYSIHQLLEGDDPSITLDIQQNLMRIFNTRQGDLIHLPEYGLPDMNAVYQHLPHSIGNFLVEMKRVISCYEPRLQAVCLGPIQNTDHSFILSIQLEGTLADGQKVHFTTDFSACKSIIVAHSSEYTHHA